MHPHARRYLAGLARPTGRFWTGLRTVQMLRGRACATPNPLGAGQSVPNAFGVECRAAVVGRTRASVWELTKAGGGGVWGWGARCAVPCRGRLERRRRSVVPTARRNREGRRGEGVCSAPFLTVTGCGGVAGPGRWHAQLDAKVDWPADKTWDEAVDVNKFTNPFRLLAFYDDQWDAVRPALVKSHTLARARHITAVRHPTPNALGTL